MSSLQRGNGGAGGRGGSSSGISSGSGGGTTAGRGGTATGGSGPEDAGSSSPDSGSAGSGAAADASVADSGTPVEAGVDAGRSCAGTPLDTVCWYLSADSQSCNQTCATHGGFDTRSLAFIGTTQQGGSVDQCARVLVALLGADDEDVQSGTRTDAGAGCHVFADGDRWWLSDPAFNANASLAGVRLACGCND